MTPFIRIYVPSVRISGNGGFTLTELMMVVLILAIGAGLAIPTVRDFNQRQCVSTGVNGLIADINYARSESIRRNGNVSICISSDGATCTGGANWADGRLVFTTQGGPLTPLRWTQRTSCTLSVNTNSPDPLPLNALGGFGAPGAAVLLGPIPADPSIPALPIPFAGIFYRICSDPGSPDLGRRRTVLLNNLGQTQIATTPPGACS